MKGIDDPAILYLDIYPGENSPISAEENMYNTLFMIFKS